MSTTLRVSLIAASAFAAIASSAAAELYKWTDENGVVNYSNTPPPKKTGSKAPVVVRDTISVYTPEKAVTDAIEDGRKRKKEAPAAVPTAAPPSATAPVAAGIGGTLSIAPPTAAASAPSDPCRVDPNDRRCQALIIYDTSPVFAGRRRAPHLVQPQLAPGTIAGNSTLQGAIQPGLSGLAPPPAPRPAPLIRGRDRDPDQRGWR